MKSLLDKIFNILKGGEGSATRGPHQKSGKFHISYIFDRIDEYLNILINYYNKNILKQYLDIIKEKKDNVFNNVMSNYVFKYFKNNNFLRLFILSILLLLCFVLLKTTIDLFNYKQFLVIMILNIFVLKLLITNFEQNQKIQNLNMIFLYLNLFLFILFFFDDLN
jgi:hypothetical protein